MMPPAVFSPSSATLPATWKAVVSGSADVGAGSAVGVGSAAGVRAVDVVARLRAGDGLRAAARLRAAAALRFVAAPERGAGGFAAVVARDPLRFWLRCPGRDRGRLPSTPG